MRSHEVYGYHRARSQFVNAVAQLAPGSAPSGDATPTNRTREPSPHCTFRRFFIAAVAGKMLRGVLLAYLGYALPFV